MEQIDARTLTVRYLFELRRRILRLFSVYLVFFILFYLNIEYCLQWILNPLLFALTDTEILMVSDVAGPVFLPVIFSAKLSFFCLIPLIFYESFAFLAPALYRKERRHLIYFFYVGILCFSIGALFCYFFVLPMMFHVFSMNVPKYMHYRPTAISALSFSLDTMEVFGLCFELPLFCFLGVSLGLFTYQQLKAARPYVIVSAFIVGMLLTPPDVLSQIMLAVPLCLLYEGTLLAIKLCQKRRRFLPHEG